MKGSQYQNTFKAGYLRRQISSMFGIWSNEYYHLYGSTLLQFKDENVKCSIYKQTKQIKPELVIDLRAYVIDGPWNQELNYIFTIRDVRDEDSFMLLGTLSYQESIEWVSCLRGAIAMSQLQELFNKPTDTINNSAGQIRLVSQRQIQPIDQELQEKIPSIIWNLIQNAQNWLQDSNWSLLIRNSGVSFFSAKNNKNIFKTNLQLDCKFCALKHWFRHQEAEARLNLFCTFSSTLLRINDNYQLVETISQFNYKGKTYDIRMYYYRYIIETAHYILIVKQSIEPNQLRQFRIREQKQNTIHLLMNNSLSYLYSLDNCCYIQSFIDIKPDRQHFALFQKFLKEQMICLGQISMESQLEQEIILEETSFNKVSIQQLQYLTIDVGYNCRIRHDRNSFESNFKFNFLFNKLTTQGCADSSKLYPNLNNKELYLKTGPQLTQQVSKLTNTENIYFRENDRESYKDQNIDMNHPAFKYAYMHDRLTQLTEKEKVILNEFKQRLAHLELNNNTLLRFLQDRNFKIKDAELMLINTYKWRKENQINSRKMEDYPQFLRQNLHLIIGLDKWGHPIIYTNSCNNNPNMFKVPNTSFEMYMKFHQAFLETACSQMRNNVDRYLVITDCYNLSLRNFSLQSIKRQLEEILKYYPERQYKNYLLNSDFIIQSLYLLVKPFLPTRIVEQIVFVGKNFEVIKQNLLQDIDIETIPQRYGGGNPLVK